jgi:hypothetical protein
MLRNRFEHWDEKGSPRTRFIASDRLDIDGQIEIILLSPSLEGDSFEVISHMRLKDVARLRDWLNDALMDHIRPVIGTLTPPSTGGTNG